MNKPETFCSEKHFWDMESGYCVGCGITLSEWYAAQEAELNRDDVKCTCGADVTYGVDGHHSTWCDKFKEYL